VEVVVEAGTVRVAVGAGEDIKQLQAELILLTGTVAR
jgi:hypothetical protein